MKQKQFEAEHAELWREIDAILTGASLSNEALPAYYRRLCQCLALALQRGYSPTLTDYLQRMAFDCHSRIYGSVVERPMPAAVIRCSNASFVRMSRVTRSASSVVQFQARLPGR